MRRARVCIRVPSHIAHIRASRIQALDHALLRALSARGWHAAALPLDLARKHVRNAEVKRRRAELDLAARDLGPLVARGVDPADEVEVVDVRERAEVRSPLGGRDGDEAVVRAFLFEDYGVWPPK